LGILPKADNTPSSPYEFIKGIKRDKSAGVDAEYSNINTFVLGWLAEKVTGKKYTDLISDLIWKPMGASSNAYVCLSDEGVPWSHGGMSVTLRDLARFGMLFTNSEIKKRQETIISLGQIKEIFDTAPMESPMPPFKWTYQWDLANDGILMKSGFGGQALYIHPEKEIVIAYFNYVDKDWGIDNIISFNALKEIINATDK
jgi:CubicO group peptidase (beta-lactamase class C family)